MIWLREFQAVVGIMILIFGGFVGFASENIMLSLCSITAGMILLALGKLIEIAEEIQHKVLELPLTRDQIRTVIHNSREYLIESPDFEVYPEEETSYPLILLDGEYYVRARICYKYLSQIEYEYTFKLPGQDPITLHRSDHYFKGVELFAFEDQVIVLLKKLNYRPIITGSKLILERGTK